MKLSPILCCGARRRAYRLIAYLTRVGQTADTIMLSAQRVDPPLPRPPAPTFPTPRLVNRLINKFLALSVAGE